ncbi:MAG: hypothetical protein AB1861_04980 [Cyanobacteriota bacterium]
MPIPTFIEIPDFSGTSKKSGVLKDSSEINYPLVRFDDTELAAVLSSVSGTYGNGEIVGTALTFNLAAANVGWSGAIQGASLNVNNTILAADTLSLLLFTRAVTATNDTALSALVLADADADSFVGAVTFANAFTLSSRTLFNAGALNLKYTSDPALSSLTGFLVLNTASSRILSAARIAVKLQVTRS